MWVERGVAGALKLAPISASEMAEMTKEAASTEESTWIGIVSSAIPARKGPAMAAASKLALIRPFAVTRSSPATSEGMAANWPALKAMERKDSTKATP